MNMNESFDIFRREIDGSVVWVGAAETFALARQKVVQDPAASVRVSSSCLPSALRSQFWPRSSAQAVVGEENKEALPLGDDHAPRQIANTVGVTENTLRSQIKSVSSKTGVKRQGELIRLLLSYSRPNANGTHPL
jgi:hypothetical protein